MDSDTFTDWIEIDLGAARNNVRAMQKITGRPVMAVVKANAYGHGIVQFSRAVLEAGAVWLAVARVEEALDLRRAGFTAPMLVMGYTPTLKVAEAASEAIALAVADPAAAREYSSLAAAAGMKARVHAKIDTGMGRLGVLAPEGVKFVELLQGLPGLDVEGIFTHFASADEPRKPTTALQLERFKGVLSALDAAGKRPRLVHAANSAASLYFPEARFDMVRPGIALYGLDPSSEAPCPPEFEKVLSWKTRLVSVKTLPEGYGVGYNHRYITKTEERMGVVAAGYADGLRRVVNINHCLVNGQRVTMIGGICMDQCMVSLQSIPDAKIGDEVVLIGKQGDQRITAEEVGAAWGTINYEVTCGLTARVPRLYR